MQYILSQEEFENLVPKKDLIDNKKALEEVVNAFRNTDSCIQHKHGKGCPCDECPIASINLETYVKLCPHQYFSK